MGRQGLKSMLISNVDYWKTVDLHRTDKSAFTMLRNSEIYLLNPRIRKMALRGMNPFAASIDIWSRNSKYCLN